MAARAGITREAVVTAALAVVEDHGSATGLSLGQVARTLGIRPQSLYAHVDGADGLRRAVAVAGLRRLAPDVATAAIGVSGPDAVAAIIQTHLRFARASPGLYEATMEPPGDDPALADAIADVQSPLDTALAALGARADDRVHWTRLFISTVSGYVRLRTQGRFALPTALDETEARLVAMLLAQLPVSATV